MASVFSETLSGSSAKGGKTGRTHPDKCKNKVWWGSECPRVIDNKFKWSLCMAMQLESPAPVSLWGVGLRRQSLYGFFPCGCRRKIVQGSLPVNDYNE